MPNASHPYTLASHTSQNLPKSMAAPTHRLTVDRKHGHTTSGIKHWGLSGCASILPRIKFGVTGQDNNPQSPTISYRQPLAPILIENLGNDSLAAVCQVI